VPYLGTAAYLVHYNGWKKRYDEWLQGPQIAARLFDADAPAGLARLEAQKAAAAEAKAAASSGKALGKARLSSRSAEDGPVPTTIELQLPKAVAAQLQREWALLADQREEAAALVELALPRPITVAAILQVSDASSALPPQRLCQLSSAHHPAGLRGERRAARGVGPAGSGGPPGPRRARGVAAGDYASSASRLC
jgi:hypothetical protein